MNGAQVLLQVLVDAGVDTCFMNPGTSEMHFVAALDRVPSMHSVLCLFEGVATGAADGFARMADRPAAVLLHLGPGLGNGLANLHNARKGQVPVVNVVGDHATYHKQYDSQLESDIETVARNASTFVRRPVTTDALAADATEAVRCATGPPGQVATLILPADVSWSEGVTPVAPASVTKIERAGAKVHSIELVADALRSGEAVAILVGGLACRRATLARAGAIASTFGAKLLSETFVARLERGAGVVAPERIAYRGEAAIAQLKGLKYLVLVGAKSPVAFFAYPGRPSYLVPDGCQVLTLASPDEDVVGAVDALAAHLEVSGGAYVPELSRPELPSGSLTAAAVGQAIGALLPENAIVADEANTCGAFVSGPTATAPPHDWLMLTGGAIGIGLPLAVGAAVACPDRRVVALEADGSAMYTCQAWWTMAREGLDVTTVIFANRSYAILNMELDRVGAEAGGPRAKAMLDLSRPDLDFVSIAMGMGVPATRATTAEEFGRQLAQSLATPGPSVIEAVLAPQP